MERASLGSASPGPESPRTPIKSAPPQNAAIYGSPAPLSSRYSPSPTLMSPRRSTDAYTTNAYTMIRPAYPPSPACCVPICPPACVPMACYTSPMCCPASCCCARCSPCCKVRICRRLHVSLTVTHCACPVHSGCSAGVQHFTARCTVSMIYNV